MRLTRLGYVSFVWLVSAAIATLCVVLAPLDSNGLREVLSNAWQVMATWLPVLFLILSTLMANSRNYFHVMLGKTGHIQFLIGDLKITTLCVLLAIIISATMDMFDSPDAPPTWLVGCSVFATIFSICLCANVARSIILIAKAMYDHAATGKSKSDGNSGGKERTS